MDIIVELRVLGLEVEQHFGGVTLKPHELGQVFEENIAESLADYCENWKARTSRTSSMYFAVF